MSGDLVTLRRDVPGAGPFAVFPVLRHAHRTTGFFKVRGINIDHGEFEDLMFRLAPINDFKCEALTLDALDVLRVCIEIQARRRSGGRHRRWWSGRSSACSN